MSVTRFETKVIDMNLKLHFYSNPLGNKIGNNRNTENSSTTTTTLLWRGGLRAPLTGREMLAGV